MNVKMLLLTCLLALLPSAVSARVSARGMCTNQATGEQRVCQVEFLSGEEVQEEVRPISPLLVPAFQPGILYVKVEDAYTGFLLLETKVAAPATVTQVPSGAVQGEDEDGDTWTVRPAP